MTSIMRRTIRGAAAGMGALAIVAGASACGSLLGGDDADKDADKGDSKVEEQEPAEGEGEGGEDDAASDEGGEDAADSEDGEDAAAGADSEDDAAASDGGEDAAASDGGGEAATPVDEAGLTAAGDRFLEFMQVLDDGDAEAACGYALDPTTGEPPAGVTLEQCSETLAPQLESIEPGTFDNLDRSMIETADNGDGTVGISFMGSEFPYGMEQGSDGEWYVNVI